MSLLQNSRTQHIYFLYKNGINLPMRILFKILPFFLIFASAHAENIIVNQSPKASVMTGFTIATQKNAGVPLQFYQSRDCQDAALAYKNTADSVIVYETMNVAAASKKGLDCSIDFQPGNVVLYTWQSFEICHLQQHSVALENSKTFGMSGMHPHAAWIGEFNKKHQANLKARIYSGSGAAAKGLLAKETDWAFIASAVAAPLVDKGAIVCPFSTDPTSAKFFGKHYSHRLADLRIKVLVLAHGKDTDKIRTGLSNQEYTTYLINAGYSHISHNMTSDQLTEFIEAYKRLQKSY